MAKRRASLTFWYERMLRSRQRGTGRINQWGGRGGLYTITQATRHLNIPGWREFAQNYRPPAQWSRKVTGLRHYTGRRLGPGTALAQRRGQGAMTPPGVSVTVTGATANRRGTPAPQLGHRKALPPPRTAALTPPAPKAARPTKVLGPPVGFRGRRKATQVAGLLTPYPLPASPARSPRAIPAPPAPAVRGLLPAPRPAQPWTRLRGGYKGPARPTQLAPFGQEALPFPRRAAPTLLKPPRTQPMGYPRGQGPGKPVRPARPAPRMRPRGAGQTFRAAQAQPFFPGSTEAKAVGDWRHHHPGKGEHVHDAPEAPDVSRPAALDLLDEARTRLAAEAGPASNPAHTESPAGYWLSRMPYTG